MESCVKNSEDSNSSSREDLSNENTALEGNDTDSACEEDILEEDLKEPESLIPQKVLDLADHALARLPPRWRNWITRMISGTTLILSFSVLVSMGPIGLISLTYLVEFACYNEVLNMGKNVLNVKEPEITSWCWYLFLVIHWLIIAPDISIDLSGLPMLDVLFKYHLAFGFTAYMALIVYFVFSMVRDQLYMKRYALFAWCHIWLLSFALPGHLLNKAMLHGLMWYVLPMGIITINDIAAYMVGFFCGRTPLIKLSPKKTKEGFIGGGLLTLLLGTTFTCYLTVPYLVCPVQINPDYLSNVFHGDFSTSLFTVTQCQIPSMLQDYSVLNGVFISLFCSLIGPFGGFLASGLKRACKRKNFGSFIPGHGGVLDRCDCMFLMAGFSYVYLKTLQTAELL